MTGERSPYNGWHGKSDGAVLGITCHRVFFEAVIGEAAFLQVFPVWRVKREAGIDVLGPTCGDYPGSCYWLACIIAGTVGRKESGDV